MPPPLCASSLTWHYVKQRAVTSSPGASLWGPVGGAGESPAGPLADDSIVASVESSPSHLRPHTSGDTWERLE